MGTILWCSVIVLCVVVVVIVVVGSHRARPRMPGMEPFGQDLPNIDAVFTWVNGADPRWRKKYRAVVRSKFERSRYQDNEELKYSLRSLAKYAAWFRHIYIVTDAQRPVWLTSGHPRIHVVDHTEIMDPQYLPTFSSRAIELNVHKIAGLSETFVYFNDDVVLVRPYSLCDVLSGTNRKLLYSREEVSLPTGAPQTSDSAWYGSLRTLNRLLDERYGHSASERKLIAHQPYPMRKALMQKLWSTFPTHVHETQVHPVRHAKGLSTPAFFAYFAFYRNQVEFIADRTHVVHSSTFPNGFLQKRPHIKFLCFQDYPSINQKKRKRLLEQMFSAKGPFER